MEHFLIVTNDGKDADGRVTAKVKQLLTDAGKTCVLCEKDTPLSCGYKSNYCGFIVPNMFIVGNGFDFDEVMREMPHVGCINQYGIQYYTEHKLI